jgi:hypothetical protein
MWDSISSRIEMIDQALTSKEGYFASIPEAICIIAVDEIPERGRKGHACIARVFPDKRQTPSLWKSLMGAYFRRLPSFVST